MEVRPKQIKNPHFKSDILKQLYFEKVLSCTELSVIFGKSIPVITKTINELIDEGFVEEVGYALSSGGRRPLLYAVKAGAMYIMAIAMDQLSTRIAIVDLANKPVQEIEME